MDGWMEGCVEGEEGRRCWRQSKRTGSVQLEQQLRCSARADGQWHSSAACGWIRGGWMLDRWIVDADARWMLGGETAKEVLGPNEHTLQSSGVCFGL